MVNDLLQYLSYPFVWRALVAGVLVALCAALLGVSLVLRRLSFIGDGLSHVAFGAMAMAGVMNFAGDLTLSLPVTIVGSVILFVTGRTSQTKGDASLAMVAVGAGRGLFLPANDEYVRRKMAKANESVVISAETRIAMLEAMCRGEPSLGISLVDMGTARTCTYESLLRVSEQNPGYDILLVIGADKIKIVPKWLRVIELLRDFKFVISRRGDDAVEDLIAKSPIADALSAATAATFEIDGNVADMSSSEVRRLFAAGGDYAALLHPAAAAVLARYTPGDFPPLDFDSWARIILSTGRFGENKVNKRVYEMNRDLFLAWARGEAVDVPSGLGDRQRLLEGTRVYSSALDASAVPACGADTKFGCANEDCVEVARELLGAGFNPAILNLASRSHACGGYDSGLSAQEEYLCRSSTLSQSLYQYFRPTLKCVKESGVPQKGNAYPLDISFGGIYSPGVRFFRTGKDGMFAYREHCKES